MHYLGMDVPIQCCGLAFSLASLYARWLHALTPHACSGAAGHATRSVGMRRAVLVMLHATTCLQQLAVPPKQLV